MLEHCHSYLDTVMTCFNESSLSSINGRKYLAIRYGPLTLTSHTAHHFSGSLSVIMDMLVRPVLFTITSSLPMTLFASAEAPETDFGSVTSSFSCKTRGSGRPASRAAFLTTFEMVSRDERAPRMMCEAPALAKLVAIAAPMPLLAPVMKTALPGKSCLVGSMAG